MTTITEPGVYPDLDAADYHRQHDWLSVSGAKKLLKPSCPAKFKAAMDGATDEHKPHFDLGKAAHTRVLGDGETVVVVDALDWRSKDAREQGDAAYAEGKVPILVADNAVIDAMAASLEAHPIAPLLFATGKAEQSIFWTDPDTGVKCRSRLDWLPDKQEGKRLIIPDLKTAVSSEPGEFSRAAARFHYAMQDDQYREAVRAVGIDEDPAFVFAVIEKEPPYVVTVGQLDRDAQQLGRDLNNKARRIYAACLATDTWPGYTDEVAPLSLPIWHFNDFEEYAAS
jgi:hypothetical protein